jgi:hypothetical protein
MLVDLKNKNSSLFTSTAQYRAVCKSMLQPVPPMLQLSLALAAPLSYWLTTAGGGDGTSLHQTDSDSDRRLFIEDRLA